MLVAISIFPFSNFLCVYQPSEHLAVVDFPGENAGKDIGRMAAKLCALATEMRADIERAILGHTPTAIAVLGFEVIPDNPFTGAHVIKSNLSWGKLIFF